MSIIRNKIYLCLGNSAKEHNKISEMKTKLSKNFLAKLLAIRPTQIRRIYEYRVSRFDCLYIVAVPYGSTEEQKVLMSSIYLRCGSISRFDFVIKDSPSSVLDHILDELSDFVSIIKGELQNVPDYKKSQIFGLD